MSSSQSSSVLRCACAAVVALCVWTAGCGERSDSGGGSGAPASSQDLAQGADFGLLHISDDGGLVVYSQRSEDGEGGWIHELYALDTETKSTHRMSENDGDFVFLSQAPDDDRIFHFAGDGDLKSIESWTLDRQETLAEGLIHAEHKPQFGVIIATRGDSWTRRDWYSIDTATGEETPIVAGAELKLEDPQGRYLIFESSAGGVVDLVLWDARDREAITITDDPELDYPGYGIIVGEQGATHVWHVRREPEGPDEWLLPGTRNEQLWVRDLSSDQRTLLDERLVMQAVDGEASAHSSTRNRIFWLSVRDDSPADSTQPRFDLKSWDGNSQTVDTLTEDISNNGLEVRVSDDESLAVYPPNQADRDGDVNGLRLAAYDFDRQRETIIAEDAFRYDIELLPGVPAVSFLTEPQVSGRDFRVWHAGADESLTLSRYHDRAPDLLGVSAQTGTAAFAAAPDEASPYGIYVVDFSDMTAEEISQLDAEMAGGCDDWFAPSGDRLLYVKRVYPEQTNRLWYHDRQTGQAAPVGEFDLGGCSNVRSDEGLERGFVGTHTRLPTTLGAWSNGSAFEPAGDALAAYVTQTEDWQHLLFLARDDETSTSELRRASFATQSTTTLAEQVSIAPVGMGPPFLKSDDSQLLTYLAETADGSCPESCGDTSCRTEDCTRPLYALTRPLADRPGRPQQLDEHAYEVLAVGEDWVLWVGASGDEGTQSDAGTTDDPVRHLRFTKIR